MENKIIISDIKISLIKPDKGLIGFCSFVIFENLCCQSIGIFTRKNGGYRLVYPTKILAGQSFHYFYPIKQELGIKIEQEVIKKLKDVIKNDRHNCTYLTN